MKLRSISCLLILALCVACGKTSADDSDPAQAARALNADSKATLGVGIRSLAFLFDADPGTYLLRNSVSLERSWPQLMALQSAGYVRVNSIQSASGEMVEIVLTPKGESVVKEFEP
ncbi:MAG: hypothetical protein QM719_06485 [Thermomonas sp.]